MKCAILFYQHINAFILLSLCVFFCDAGESYHYRHGQPTCHYWMRRYTCIDIRYAFRPFDTFIATKSGSGHRPLRHGQRWFLNNSWYVFLPLFPQPYMRMYEMFILIRRRQQNILLFIPQRRATATFENDQKRQTTASIITVASCSPECGQCDTSFVFRYITRFAIVGGSQRSYRANMAN